MLSRAGYDVLAFSRSERRGGDSERVRWKKLDLAANPTFFTEMDGDALIYLAPLETLAAVLSSVDSLPIRRMIAFSSTSALTKGESSDAAERRYVQRLQDAERAIVRRCEALDMRLTIFRPTLIYGAGIDKNVSFIAKCIVSLGFFPLANGATGRRQPVHAEDLAAACVQSLDEAKTFNTTYTLAGGDILTYKEMVLRIFAALNRPPRIVSLPVSLYKLVLRSAKLSGRFRYFLSPAMAERMNQDMIFDYAQARRDFGFAPRGFEPTRGELTPIGTERV
jgi:nucleoside-diphosphate-sugar epimerase